jgi:FecR-like protein
MLVGIAAAPVAANAQARSALQPAAILTVISGDVLLRSARGDFSPAMDGAVLYVGTMLRTSADARALITLFEGSTVELDPASDITIEEATMRSGSTIEQALGRSWHVVTHLTTADSRYEPTTPAATASVRGGDYEVTAADANSGLTTTMTTLDQRVPTTLVFLPTSAKVETPVQTSAKVETPVQTSATVETPAQTSAKVETPAQTTAVRANAAPVSTRSTASVERVRTFIAQALAARAVLIARARDGAWSGYRDNDQDNDRDKD